MKYYFYSENNEKKGPVTLEEIKSLRLKDNCKIWYDGLPNWVNANDVEEIKPFLVVLPPKLQEEIIEDRKDLFKKDKSKVIINESIILIIVLTIILDLIAVNGAISESNNFLGDAFPVYMTAYEKENPQILLLKFLPYTFIISAIIGIIFFVNKKNELNVTSNKINFIDNEIDDSLKEKKVDLEKIINKNETQSDEKLVIIIMVIMIILSVSLFLWATNK
jgi:hypothetical protein